MTRYRNKQLEVEAVQWTGENREEVEAMVGQPFDPRQVAIIGDWVVCDSNGKISGLAPARFEATYEPADQPAQGVDDGRAVAMLNALIQVVAPIEDREAGDEEWDNLTEVFQEACYLAAKLGFEDEQRGEGP